MACWCKGSCPHIGVARQSIQAERWYEAQKTLEARLLDAPYCIEANLALGGVLENLNLAAFAGVHFERARKTLGDKMVPADEARFSFMLGRNLVTQTRLEDAAKLFTRTIELDATHFAARVSLIETLTKMGELDQASIMLGETALKFPDRKRALMRPEAEIMEARGMHAAAIAAWPDGTALGPRELFDRGRLYDAIGKHDLAWADWMTAKEHLREVEHHHFEAAGIRVMLEALEFAAQPGRIELVENGYEECAPIFIGGFPRSGTTLLETVLTSHPNIEAGDEMRGVLEAQNMLPMFLDIAVPYPQCIGASTSGNNLGVMRSLGERYATRARRKVSIEATTVKVGASRFTDKMPLNEIHWLLITKMLPRAVMFYMRRHPLDILVSNMSYWIRHGWDYASSMESAVAFYVMADKLIQHYKTVLPRNFHEVRYEGFIADQAAGTISIMDTIGLPMEEAQLTFHNNRRHSRTISHDQVRKPLYSSSVARYKNYVDFIPPELIDALRPIMAREGYEI